MKKKKNSLNPLIIFLATIIIVLSIIYGIFINPIKQDNDYIKEHSKFDVHFENPQAILVPEEKRLDGLDFNESSTTLSFSAFSKGSAIVKIVPSISLSTLIIPPCNTTICLAIFRPSPVPPVCIERESSTL